MVLLDEESDSEFADRGDRRLVHLPHPIESDVLKDLRLTEERATREGRLATARLFLCGVCGEMTGVRRMGVPGWVRGPTAMVAGGIVIGFVYGVGAACLTRYWWIGVGVGLIASVCGTLWMRMKSPGDAKLRRRFPERAQVLDTPHRCQKCGSDNLLAPSTQVGPLPCPKCAARRLRVVSVGIS